VNALNRLLSIFGVRVSRVGSIIPKDFRESYSRQLKEVVAAAKDFAVFDALYYEFGDHPASYVDYEIQFASEMIRKAKALTILDIGSYRHWVVGLLSNYDITSVDVRDRKSILSNETAVNCDAKKLRFNDESFDLVTSLSTLEHCGLGRYGEEFDLEADSKVFSEMVRVLKPNGHLVFTTTITAGKPSIVFNAHRIYSYGMIKAFCKNMMCVSEKFFSHSKGNSCSIDELAKEEKVWDVYCGCWKKQE
jgi:SAM-dependent methyltransferase